MKSATVAVFIALLSLFRCHAAPANGVLLRRSDMGGPIEVPTADAIAVKIAPKVFIISMVGKSRFHNLLS